MKFAEKEGINKKIITLDSLLHEVNDYKIVGKGSRIIITKIF